MWQSIDSLLGRGQPPADATITATNIHCVFDKKVADIRASTCSAADPVYSVTYCAFPGFSAVTADDVIAAVRKLPNKPLDKLSRNL